MAYTESSILIANKNLQNKRDRIAVPRGMGGLAKMKAFSHFAIGDIISYYINIIPLFILFIHPYEYFSKKLLFFSFPKYNTVCFKIFIHLFC